MSLVEATVVLAVISALTAVLAPSIRDYIDASRQARAQEDVAVLAAAMSRMLTDIGETFFLRDGNGTTTTDPPSRASTNRVNLLVGNGMIPTIETSVDRAPGNTDWDDTLDTPGASADVWSFYDQLVANQPAYRSAAEMNVAAQFDPDGGDEGNSEFYWRGAYLTPIVGPDPWGYRYMANVEFLGHPSGSSPSENDVVVLSAGPNARVDTAFAATTPTLATDSFDDIHALVSGGTR